MVQLPGPPVRSRFPHLFPGPMFQQRALQLSMIYDGKNVKFEWLINYRITLANVANLLSPGT